MPTRSATAMPWCFATAGLGGCTGPGRTRTAALRTGCPTATGCSSPPARCGWCSRSVRSQRSGNRLGKLRAASRGGSYPAEHGVERIRQPVEIHRPGEQAPVPELAPGTAAQEPPQLCPVGLTAPFRLPLQAAERAEISLRLNERFNPGRADRADQLVLQILDADVESQSLHVGPRPGRADTGARQTAPDDVLLADVAQAGQSEASSSRTELPQVARDRVRATYRQDYHALRAQVPAAACGKRLDRDLVADALDKQDSLSGPHLCQRPGCGLGRSRRAVHITVQQSAGKLTAPGDVHRT